MSIKVDIETRLARAEAVAESIRAEFMTTLEKAYNNAVANEDEETAAELARKIRNKLLDESDKEVSIDRLGLNADSITDFIRGLSSFFKGDWAKYRQALRDLPQQEGFPFSINFPVKPGEEAEE